MNLIDNTFAFEGIFYFGKNKVPGILQQSFIAFSDGFYFIVNIYTKY